MTMFGATSVSRPNEPPSGDPPRGFRADQAGDLAHRPLYGSGELAELSHGAPRLGQAYLWPRPRPPNTGGDGHVPVDHLPAAHTSTVRGARDVPSEPAHPF